MAGQQQPMARADDAWSWRLLEYCDKVRGRLEKARRAAARRRGGLRAARRAARAVLALHLRRRRRDFGQGIAAASRQGQRTALEQRRVAVGEEKQRGCH